MTKKKSSPPMKVYDGQGKELMIVRSMSKEGNDLIISGKIMGSMPMKARVTPEEARAAFKLLDIKTIWFLLTLLFRRSTKKA